MQKRYYELDSLENLHCQEMADIAGGIIIVCRQSLVDTHDAMKRVTFNAASDAPTMPGYLKGLMAAGANLLS